MPAPLALGAWFVLLIALFRYDGEKKTSLALWVPVLWFAVIGSRLPSQWLGVRGDVAQMMTEGNGFDRLVYVLLIVLALSILSSRGFAWGRFFIANFALTSILLFSLLSVAWSDFPFVAFKRWFRDLGTYLAILVALTDAGGLDGVRMLLRRVCYLLIPLSIVLIKYLPEMAKHYDAWSGEAFFIGVTTSKNMLGVLCLVSGLYFFWDTLIKWPKRDDPIRRRVILINVAFISMTLWLLSMANSATSTVCLVLGALIIVLAHTNFFKRRPAVLATGIFVGIFSYVLLEFVFDVHIIATLAVAVGRNPDLTGRTNIWNVVLASGTNPFVGAGYESFWLGERLQWVWERAGAVNEAHNGFLEVYLTLGLIGLSLYIIFLFGSFFSITRRMKTVSIGSMSLALWTVLIFYNVTESALRGHLMWIAFLLGAVTLPAARRTSVREIAGPDRSVRSGHSRARSGRQIPHTGVIAGRS
jgi:O-antigen ligase